MLGSMRALALSMLVALGGCEAVVRAQASACADVAWGGWSGSPACRALSERTIAGADRGCTTDADCALIHPGVSCREGAVSASAVGRYRPLEAACTNPAAGPCSPAIARCVAGCCAASR